LKWQAILEYVETVKFTSEWYYEFHKGESDMLKITINQIEKYTDKASQKGMIWTA
jgi:CDP-glucose 4,6-dehydratase